MAGLAFAIAASANVDALLMSPFGRRLSTKPSISVGPFSALGSLPLAFLTGIVVSFLSPERRAEERFLDAERQIHLGAAAGSPPPPAAEPVPTHR